MAKKKVVRKKKKAPAKKKGAKRKTKAVEPEVLSEDELRNRPKVDSDAEVIDVEIESEDDLALDEASVEPQSTSVTFDSESRALSPTDPLRRYMMEVQQHPLLTPEEELKYANQLKDEGDVEAAKILVQANLRLVVKIAYEYRSVYSNLLDLVQEGNVGLMKAVSKFDPTKGAKLSYYASWWIRSYILKYILDNFRLVKIGTTQAQKKLFYHLIREKQRLEAQGILAGPKLLAERLDVKEKEVVEMSQRLSSEGAEMSLDAPVGQDKGDGESRTSFSDLVADDQESPEDEIAHQQLLQLLKDNLPDFEKTLDDKEAQILNERLLAEPPKTLREIAEAYGLTRERVRQIEAKMIEKLREFLQSDSL